MVKFTDINRDITSDQRLEALTARLRQADRDACGARRIECGFRPCSGFARRRGGVGAQEVTFERLRRFV